MTARAAEILAELKEIVSEDEHNFYDLSLEGSATVHAKLATRVAELERELNDDAIVRLAASLARIMEQSQRIRDAIENGTCQESRLDTIREANDAIHREVAQHLPG